MRSRYLLGLSASGFHKLHYTEWGSADNPRVLICVHGLTRNGRDFDALASALRDEYRVVCPDLPGRGRSDWLDNMSDYGYPVYLADIAVLIGRLDIESIDWVGTSLGGLIGMLLAAQPQTPIRRMIINDIGPQIEAASIKRIQAYTGTEPTFNDLPGLERYVRTVYAPFGSLSDEQWRHLAEHSARCLLGGGYALHYDPGIAEALQKNVASFDWWSVWDRVRCSVRVLRGRDSDLLSAETAAAMRRRGPKADLIEFAGVGHAPPLMSADQISAVREWLLAPSAFGHFD
ncbi:MAG: alpha/beta fold hydrolase [Gammaproteobacteria bacterium]